MSVYDVSGLEMTRSGETIDFVHGTLTENELDGNVHYNLTLKNVTQYELFYDKLQAENPDPVTLTITLYDGKSGQAEMRVRTVNRRDPNNSIIELESTNPIEFS